MKIYIARFEPNRTGGGWSFQQNLYAGLKDEMAVSYDEADVYFITSPSMLKRDEVLQAKADGKKIVLRIDNAVRNSRNRNTGMTRMYDMAQVADLIIYQSNWAKDYLEPFVGQHNSAVILNGTDINIFHPPTTPADPNVVLYSRFNRDETKNFEVARYWFSRLSQQNPDAKLFIVGQFSDDIRSANFDFYAGEMFRYLGVLDKRTMADLYRQCGKYLYTYFNDACSNTLIEALCSGCEVVGDAYYRKTGGAAEIMSVFKNAPSLEQARRFFSNERMVMEYKEAIGGLL